MNNKVAIVGASKNRQQVPWDNEEFDIWGLNHRFKSYKRFDKWFELHNINKLDKARINKLYSFQDKVIISKPNILLPNALIYPYKEAIDLVGGEYFNNSISYMIIYAILNKYKSIYLYGVEMNNDNENREQQKNCLRETIFFAKGLGIDIVIDNNTLLNQYPIYGNFKGD